MTNEQLVNLIQGGKDVKNNLATLYQKNLGLIRMWLAPLLQKFPEQEEDIMQEAYFGVHNAAQKFDLDRGNTFTAFAEWMVKSCVYRTLEPIVSNVRHPAHWQDKMNKYRRATACLSNTLGRSPTAAEIAEFTGFSEGMIKDLAMSQQETISLDQPVDGNENLSLGDMLSAGTDLEDSVTGSIYHTERREILWDVVNRTVAPDQEELLREIYENGETLTQIANRHGKTVRDVQRSKNEALRLLRRHDVLMELSGRLEDAECLAYRSSLSRFRHFGTSSTEAAAIKKVCAIDWAQQKYK